MKKRSHSKSLQIPVLLLKRSKYLVKWMIPCWAQWTKKRLNNTSCRRTSSHKDKTLKRTAATPLIWILTMDHPSERHAGQGRSVRRAGSLAITMVTKDVTLMSLQLITWMNLLKTAMIAWSIFRLSKNSISLMFKFHYSNCRHQAETALLLQITLCHKTWNNLQWQKQEPLINTEFYKIIRIEVFKMIKEYWDKIKLLS